MTTGAERGARVSDYDYELPEGRIARHPAARRDESRLLVLDRTTGVVDHRRFVEFVGLPAPGDLVVLNESRVIRARLLGRKPTGARAEILLLRPAPDHSGPLARAYRWEAMVRPGSKLKPGRTVEVGPELVVRVLEGLPGGTRLVELDTSLAPMEALDRYGAVPLPPYLERDPVPEDEERYQTVYAAEPGSVAAPTAGLHFTEPLLDALRGRGVETAAITLHVGAGTFRPVEVDDPAEHLMHEESFQISVDTAARIAAVRGRGGRIWAVGTTVVRALESAAGPDGELTSGPGTTDLFIRPPYAFRIVDALLTNFHLPRSTLLMLVAAFGGYEKVMGAYRQAIEERYRFYSYGDAMAVVGEGR